MSYKLKTANGKVAFLLKTGKDFVKNQMAVAPRKTEGVAE